MYAHDNPLLRCSRADLLAIIEKSAFLHERLGPEFLPKYGDFQEDDVLEVLGEWRKRVADGGEERFQKRLAWEGLDSARAKELVAGVRLKDPHHLPDWAQILEGVLNNISSKSNLTLDALESAMPVLGRGGPAFAHVMAEFLEYAVHQVQHQTADGWGFLRAAVKISLQRQLLGRLRSFAQETLLME